MDKNKPQAIIFDLDDTLINYDGISEECWRSISREFAPNIEGITDEQLYQVILKTRRWFWDDPERHQRGRIALDQGRFEIMAEALNRLGIESPSLARTIADRYTALRSEKIYLFPDVLKALERLRREGYPLGLITNGNGNLQEGKIRRFSLESYFDSILIEGRFGAGKPDPRVFHHVLKELNVKPEHAWMVGDSLVRDIDGAQRVGMKGIWCYRYGKEIDPASAIKPDLTIRTLDEIPFVA